ncbi:outer membrane protein assembly factor BamB family protein [Nocardiopsis alba]|uniref:outer membrane protein assembly factor BamB family protein n=1 Tax=Nocardiopsis alba TaxID=53437 RepID=UPI00037839CE|nr:PQQ-binding-like beta-propeller repeat protein [Nocardiopsis alba]
MTALAPGLFALMWVLTGFPLLVTGAGAMVALGLVALQALRPDGDPLLPVPGIVAVLSGIVLFGAMSAAAYIAWPPPWSLCFIALLLVDVLFRIGRWKALTTGGRGRKGELTSRTAIIAVTVVVLAGLLSPLYSSRAADAALCARPAVARGASDAWPDGEPLRGGDDPPRNPGMLDRARAFEGNAAFGEAAWWLPLWGGVTTGNRTSVVLNGVRGFGVYEAEDGRVRWTFDIKEELFGVEGRGGARTIHSGRVKAVGDVLLVRLHDDGADDPREALLALDMETGRRLWCAPGVTDLLADPESADRIVVFDGAWRILDTGDGREIATIDTETTSLSEETFPNADLTPLTALGGGRFVLAEGPAVAVYDTIDGALVHDRLLEEPPAHPAPGTGHAVYNIVTHETATVFEVSAFDGHRADREFASTELIAFGPGGEELWRKNDLEGGRHASITLGSYSRGDAVRTFGDLFWREPGGVDISDGTFAWTIEDRVHLSIDRGHQVRGGLLFGANELHQVIAIDSRSGEVHPSPYTVPDPTEREERLLRGIDHIATPAGDVFTTSGTLLPGSHGITVLFGLPEGSN